MNHEWKQKPDDWDWVSERGRCSGAAVFETLWGLARESVKKRNDQNKEGTDKERFNISQPQRHTFVVSDTFVRFESRAVAVELGSEEIHVRRSGKTEETVYTLSLNDSGDCRLLSGGVHYQPWQVMRRALEDLFFGDWTRSV